MDDLADRRNIIAHELDFQPNSPDKRPIDYDYVLHTLNVIQFMIEAANYQIIESIKNGQKQDINMDEKYDPVILISYLNQIIRIMLK